MIGYYELEDQRWVIEVKAITTQKEAIFQTLLLWKGSVELMAKASMF